MTTKEIEILDHVNGIKALKTVDARVNYVYNAYDFGLSKMNEVREYFKMNINDTE
jgi:hypothetical protein